VDYGADNCWGYGCFAEEPEKAYWTHPKKWDAKIIDNIRENNGIF
jgi:hypothetical protein